MRRVCGLRVLRREGPNAHARQTLGGSSLPSLGNPCQALPPGQKLPLVLPLCFRCQLPREFGLHLGCLLETSSIASALPDTTRQPVCMYERKHGCPGIFPNENLVNRLGACGEVLAIPHPHPHACNHVTPFHVLATQGQDRTCTVRLFQPQMPTPLGPQKNNPVDELKEPLTPAGGHHTAR